MQANNSTKIEKVQSSSRQVASKGQSKQYQQEEMTKHNSQHQLYSPQTASNLNQRRNSGIDLQNLSKSSSHKILGNHAKTITAASTYRQFHMNANQLNPTNYALKSFQPTLKPIPNLSSPNKINNSNRNKYISKADIFHNGQQFQDNGLQQHNQMKQMSNLLIKQTASPTRENESIGDRASTEQYFTTNKNNISLNAIQQLQQDPNFLNTICHHSQAPFSAKNYYYSPKKISQKQLSQTQKINPAHTVVRSVSNMQHYRRKWNPNSINSLNNINDFEDTQIFQDFQKPQLSTQMNESMNNQQTESTHQISTIQSIPAIKRDNNQKPFSAKSQSTSQLQTMSGFQKLQRVRKALALGAKVAQFLEILKSAPTQKYDQASEQYSKECIQILKGILQEKEQEADQFEQMELEDEHDRLNGLAIQKGIGKKTENLTKKVLRTIQDSIVEPISQRTYRGLYYDKCKEIDKIKFGYKDMEKEVEILRKNQQVFDDIATNYFLKTESIEKERNKLVEEKKAALLEVERLERKLDESNNYYSFWQGEYHQVSRKYNEEVYALGQYEEKMKREKTEKVFLENQLSALQKQVENKQGELEKIKSTQIQLKWMKGSISTYQQDLLNKNIQINLCKDLVVSKSEALKILSKEELDKEQPLIDLVKQVFQAIAQKLN